MSEKKKLKGRAGNKHQVSHAYFYLNDEENEIFEQGKKMMLTGPLIDEAIKKNHKDFKFGDDYVEKRFLWQQVRTKRKEIGLSISSESYGYMMDILEKYPGRSRIDFVQEIYYQYVLGPMMEKIQASKGGSE